MPHFLSNRLGLKCTYGILKIYLRILKYTLVPDKNVSKLGGEKKSVGHFGKVWEK